YLSGHGSGSGARAQASQLPLVTWPPPGHISAMAWFRKEKKARQARSEPLEIPPDIGEKCESCGHTDIGEKFARNFNVCPSCDYHRRIRAIEYCNIVLDAATCEEVEGDMR